MFCALVMHSYFIFYCFVFCMILHRVIFCFCDIVFLLVCSGIFVLFGCGQRSESEAESSRESSASLHHVCSDTDPSSWHITHSQHWLFHAERLVINSIVGFSEQCQSQTTHGEGGAQVDAHRNNAWRKYVSGPIQSWGDKLIIFFTLFTKQWKELTALFISDVKRI